MQIAPGVYSIGRPSGRRAYLGGYSRAYLLDDPETGLTLIDALSDADGALVLEQIERLGRSVRDLERILLTHAHRSHVMGLARLKTLSGAAVYAHEWEAGIVAGGRRAQPVSMRPASPLSLVTMRVGLMLGAGHPPCRVDEHLADGQKVGPVTAIHAPGHTPGHMVFYWPERQALFTGDNVAAWPRFSAGWPNFQLDDSLFRASLGRTLAAVEKLATHDPPVAVIGVSHGDPVTRGAYERLKVLVEAETSSS
jgi:glyoxylase-like metal-dependent hydrolase (beta-lactamase superfamily II)